MRLQALRVAVFASVFCAGVMTVGVPAIAATGPAIFSFSPVSGTIGNEVTIKGQELAGVSKVAFNGALSQFTVVSANEITATVPALASTGPIKVTLSHGIVVTSKAPFTVTPGIVLSTASGPPTSTVTVTGAGFGPFEAVDIYFDVTDQVLASTSGTGTFAGITFQVPASALPGTHYITAVGRHSGLSAQSGFTVETNWSQFRNSAKHKAVNPYENVLSPATVAGIDEDWSFTTEGFVTSSPAMVNGIVYFGSFDDNVYALNASTGAKRWSFATGGTVASSPAVANGLVYVGSADGNIYALNASTGAKRWSFTTGNTSSSPAVVNGVVYIGDGDGVVFALDASTGAKRWSFATGGTVAGSPAVANGVVYIGSESGNLYALSATTGAELWSFTTGGNIDSSAAVANGVVYVGSEDGNVYALNASTGAKLWSFTTGSIVDSSPAVANGVVYIGSDDDNLYALSASTGAKLWNFTTGGEVNCSPTVANGVVYVGSADENLYALSASTGARLWRFTIGSGIFSSPTVVNGVVYDGSDENSALYAFDLAGGLASPSRPTPASLRPNYRLQPLHGRPA